MENQRTIQQNSALHEWFTLVSEALNAEGLDVRIVLQNTLDVYWRPDLVKELLWRQAQKAVLKKESTTELSTTDIDRVWEVLNKFLGEKCEIHIPFPSNEELKAGIKEM